jgi:hypothetical protein
LSTLIIIAKTKTKKDKTFFIQKNEEKEKSMTTVTCLKVLEMECKSEQGLKRATSFRYYNENNNKTIKSKIFAALFDKSRSFL